MSEAVSSAEYICAQTVGHRRCSSFRSEWFIAGVQADNLAYLSELPSASFTVIYIDPPFNTGKTQTRRTLKTAPAADGEEQGKGNGNRTGFQGKSYTSAFNPSELSRCF